MKIAVIAKAEIDNPKTYTAHKNKVTYHPETLFLSKEDKSALEYAMQLIEIKGGTIDTYTFEQDEVADRVLHEALAIGANTATKIVVGNSNDPTQQNQIAKKFVHYLQESNKNYDLLLTGCTMSSEFAAIIAQKLNIEYYDHLSMIDTSFNFEMKLERGKIKGKCKLPAVLATLDSINIPRLPNYNALSNAISSNITIVTCNKEKEMPSSIIGVKTNKKEKVIFDLKQDPEATQKLIDTLKQDGILR
jgi:electron transfer flavoprotein beta subunit